MSKHMDVPRGQLPPRSFLKAEKERKKAEKAKKKAEAEGAEKTEDAKESGAVEKKNTPPKKVVPYEKFEVTIIEENGVLKGKAGDQCFDLFGGRVRVGEVWIGYTPGEVNSVVLDKRVSEAPSVESAEPVTESEVEEVEEDIDIEEPVVKSKKTVGDDSDLKGQLAELKKALKAMERRAEKAEKALEVANGKVNDLTEKNKAQNKTIGEQNRRIGKLEKDVKDMETLKKENKTQKASIIKLSNEKKALESADYRTAISNLESERDEYRNKYIDALEKVSTLTEMLNCANREGTRGKDAVFNIGRDTLHSNMFTSDRYTVYFSPRKKILKFTPSENGQVLCEKNEVRIPALWKYNDFTQVCALDFQVDGDTITVQL